jgi:tetratricopeptide (TPR) repeat protein
MRSWRGMLRSPQYITYGPHPSMQVGAALNESNAERFLGAGCSLYVAVRIAVVASHDSIGEDRPLPAHALLKMKTHTPEICRVRIHGRVFSAALMLAILLAPLTAQAQATLAWEGTIAIPTYQLGPPDPNPPFALMNQHPVYPYPMLDDLSDQRAPKSYRAIYLENQYLKVTVLPELGGHVYSVYDKLNHREMLYRNQVIKYGLVGPRGAWIAGGMEFSFPFAHTTDTVSNVESTLRQNADGSATAVVGAIDWVSNMYWEIALTLRPDTARLEEGVTLFNATPLNHLYLFWTNTAVPATDDLQYIYPMRETISDDPFAIVQSWPAWQGVDQSWYKNDPSAMAIFARDVQRNFFGVYYHQSNYGVVHVADFRQDPGKKVWSWGTARSGRIWDHILSDDDGPYNEIQSGRFATQGYREFMEPRRVEKWTEYWYPISGLEGGFVEATSQMALNVAFRGTDSTKNGAVKILFSPVADVQNATVTVSLGSSVLRTIHNVRFAPLHSAAYTFPVDNLDQARKELSVKVQSAQGKMLLAWSASAPADGNPDLVPSAGKPMQTPISLTPETPSEELYLQGVFLEKSGDPQAARKIYEQVLQRDPAYVPALLRQALSFYRGADFAQAEHLVELASQRENENPAVAYAAGLIYRAEGRFSLANDAFWSVIHYGPASTPGLSLSPAYLELGEIAIRQGNYAKAVDLLQLAVDGNSTDALALADLAVAQRLNGNRQNAAAASTKASHVMPLLPYALAENWQDTAAKGAPMPTPVISRSWTDTIGSDPQNYLAVAAWYHDLGAWQSADAVLHAAIAKMPAQTLSPLVYYYLASNSRVEGNLQQAAQFAAKAASLPISEVFPNSITDAAVLMEAVRHAPQDAHAKYALGNFLFAHTRYAEAAALWSAALEQNFNDPVLLRNLGVYEWHVKDDLASAARYYARAIELAPTDYRLYADLDEIYEQEDIAAARTKLFHDAPPDVLDRDTVRARHALFFIEQSQPDQALALLVDHRFKPWEGGVLIHNMFVRANMEKGRKALAEHQPEQAAKDFANAMQYPEDLGTGEPSQPELTEQLYWLGVALNAEGKTAEATSAWQSAAARADGKADVFSALALGKLGQDNLAKQMLERCVEGAKRPNALANDYLVAGIAELYKGDKEHAEEDFRHALRLDPLLWQARVAGVEMNNP